MVTQERRGPKHPVEEIVQRGEAIYEALRPQIETEENIGRPILIDIESGDYEISEDRLSAYQRLRSRHSDPEVYGVRVGYMAMGSIGGSMKRRPE